MSEANLGHQPCEQATEKYKEVLVCIDNSPAAVITNSNYILSDTTNRTTMRELATTTTYGGGQRTYISLGNKSWQGGVTTVLSENPAEDPLTIQQEPPRILADFMPDQQSSASLSPNSAEPVKSRGGGRRPAIKTEEEKLSPEELERRRIRRERNKEAAARCRKRRVDQTTSLQVGVAQ